MSAFRHRRNNDHRELHRLRGRPAARSPASWSNCPQRAAVPRDGIDPFRAMLDFSGRQAPEEGPVLARLFPDGLPGGTRPAAAGFRRFTEGTLRVTARRPPRSRSSTASRRPGCLGLTGTGSSSTSELDVRRPRRPGCAPSPICAWPSVTRLEVEEGATRRTGTPLPDEDPRAQAHDITEVGRLPCRRRWWGAGQSDRVREEAG